MKVTQPSSNKIKKGSEKELLQCGNVDTATGTIFLILLITLPKVNKNKRETFLPQLGWTAL